MATVVAARLFPSVREARRRGMVGAGCPGGRPGWPYRVGVGRAQVRRGRPGRGRAGPAAPTGRGGGGGWGEEHPGGGGLGRAGRRCGGGGGEWLGRRRLWGWAWARWAVWVLPTGVR